MQSYTSLCYLINTNTQPSMRSQVTLLLAALLIYVMSLTKAYVTDYEAEIKHFLTYFNLSAEIYYDDLVATVNGFSGNIVCTICSIYNTLD